MVKLKPRTVTAKTTASIDKAAKPDAPSFVKPRSKEISYDTLKNIRAGIELLHNTRLEKSDAELRVKELNVKIFDMERKTLPDLLNQAGIPSLTVEAAGNHPAFTVEKKPYYRANIAADWDPERKQKAFDWLTAHGGGDLIKTEITIYLPMKSAKLAKTVTAALRKLKVEFNIAKAVPWGSLTAFVKECYERRKITPPLDILGADVGEIVKIREKSS